MRQSLKPVGDQVESVCSSKTWRPEWNVYQLFFFSCQIYFLAGDYSEDEFM